MQSLKFKQLLLLSDTNKSANQFEFHKSRNLITADDNSVGKSTFVKLILWTMGCEPTLDSKWKSEDCKVIVEFSIGDDIYSVKRYKDQISIKENNKNSITYPKITGDYANVLAKLLNFKALLPNRKTGLLETPPPAYYFLPFYIDQKRSWAKAWDNFEKLEQYKDWRSTIIKYHVGLLTDEFFNLKYEIMEKNNTLNIVTRQIEKYENAIEVVTKYIPEITMATADENQFELLTHEIRIELKDIQINQEKLLDNFTQLQADKTHLEHQKVISERIILELEEDYKFSVENIDSDKFECPLCGTSHENSIVNRTSIIVDKKQAENQLESINRELISINKKLNDCQISLQKMKNRITEINNKYIIIENDDRIIDFNQIIEQIAGTAIKNSTIDAKDGQVIEKASLTKEINKKKKELKGLISDDETEKINNAFLTIFGNNIITFGAESVNLAEIKTPLDYNKIIKEGGAAEGTRAILAYYIAIFTMVLKFSSEVVSPLIIDTPNQQEQSDFNYSNCKSSA